MSQQACLALLTAGSWVPPLCLLVVWVCVHVRRYFSLFMNLLNECSEAAPEDKDVGRHRLQSSKLGELRTCTIQAMSNLLSANIDSGLMHSIGEHQTPLVSRG